MVSVFKTLGKRVTTVTTKGEIANVLYVFFHFGKLLEGGRVARISKLTEGID